MDLLTGIRHAFRNLSASRRREFVVREALGTTRWRLFRQSLAEQILLVAEAAVISLRLAKWGASVIRALGATRLPRLYDLSVDARSIRRAQTHLLG